nr:hypothetical protein OG999_13210 [Streptomyces sp. NBC_00886]
MDEFGGPAMFNCRLWDWTWAGNTPFRPGKRANCRGSADDPLLVRRPSGIRTRDVAHAQCAHLVNQVPTPSTSSASNHPER